MILEVGVELFQEVIKCDDGSSHSSGKAKISGSSFM